MWPRPDDPATVQRMRAAHALAREPFHARPAPRGRQVWGWRGRTLGQPVITAHGIAWLRLTSAPADQIIDTFWNGVIDAQRHIPASIPRPQLRAWHDWTDQPWAYRAELHDHVDARPVARIHVRAGGATVFQVLENRQCVIDGRERCTAAQVRHHPHAARVMFLLRTIKTGSRMACQFCFVTAN